MGTARRSPHPGSPPGRMRRIAETLRGRVEAWIRQEHPEFAPQSPRRRTVLPGPPTTASLLKPAVSGFRSSLENARGLQNSRKLLIRKIFMLARRTVPETSKRGFGACAFSARPSIQNSATRNVLRRPQRSACIRCPCAGRLAGNGSRQARLPPPAAGSGPSSRW